MWSIVVDQRRFGPVMGRENPKLHSRISYALLWLECVVFEMKPHRCPFVMKIDRFQLQDKHNNQFLPQPNAKTPWVCYHEKQNPHPNIRLPER
jgi:hypothetical protein